MADLQSSNFENTVIESTENSNSISTGALTTLGGLGVNGNLAVNGSTLSANGQLQLANRLAWTSGNANEVGRLPLPYFRYNIGQITAGGNRFMASGSPVSAYNNAPSTGTVTVSRIASDGTTPNNTGFMIRITSTGNTSPGRGGCTSSDVGRSNVMLLLQITARIPTGYTINFASNSTGSPTYRRWLTPQDGTGKWERYVHLTQCGTGGQSTTNFVWLNGPAPVTWDISSWTVNRF